MSGIATHPVAAPHGTRTRYVAAKCRCEACRAANRQYCRDRQKLVNEMRPHVKPSGPPLTGTIVRDGRACAVTFCPGANGKPCVRSSPTWLRGQGEVCAACVERATVWSGNVPVGEARAHLLKLREEGVGYRSVAAASDVANDTLRRVLAGEGRIRASTAKRLLDVDAGAIADHALASEGAVRRMKRRLDELVALGFRKCHLARLLGSNAQAPQAGRAGGALVSSVAAVDRLWNRVERGEVKPQGPLVAARPVRKVVDELLEEGWIEPSELNRRLGFRAESIGSYPQMRRWRAERVQALADELRRARLEADESEERAHDLERFALARNAAE